jgi:hypothetical protein
MKYDICLYLEYLTRKFNIYLNVTRITGTLHEDQYTFVTISRSVLLKMRNVSDKIVEKFKAHILRSLACFPKSCSSINNVENYSRTVEATDDNMADAHFTLST